jgi:hypothetical protein
VGRKRKRKRKKKSGSRKRKLKKKEKKKEKKKGTTLHKQETRTCPTAALSALSPAVLVGPVFAPLSNNVFTTPACPR